MVVATRKAVEVEHARLAAFRGATRDDRLLPRARARSRWPGDLTPACQGSVLRWHHAFLVLRGAHVSRRGWLLLVAVGVIWGIPYLLIKIAVRDVTPVMVVFVRTALGALLLLPFAVRGGGLRVLRGRWRAVLGFAVLEIVRPWILLSNAERTLSSSTTGLLVATVPIAAVVLGRLVGDRRPVALIRWIGLLVGLGGVGPAARTGSCRG